jgi:MraZ protein
VSDFVFQGESALSLDGKGRVTVPSRYRDALAALCQGQMTLTKSPSRCLLLFPRPAWVEFRAKILALPMEADGFRRLYLGSAMDVDMDSASRILLSPELRGWARLEKELMLVGMGARLEVWDRERYLANEEATLAQPMPDALRQLVI